MSDSISQKEKLAYKNGSELSLPQVRDVPDEERNNYELEFCPGVAARYERFLVFQAMRNLFDTASLWGRLSLCTQPFLLSRDIENTDYGRTRSHPTT